MEPRH